MPSQGNCGCGSRRRCADREGGHLQRQRNLPLVRPALHRGRQLQRRQSGPDTSENGNLLYAGDPGIQRRRRLPSPGAGPGRPDTRRGHGVPCSGGERDRAAELRIRLRRALSVANHHQHHRGHDGRRVDPPPVHLRAARQERLRFHHRGRAGQLQRDGFPGGCHPSAARQVRPLRAGDLRVPLAIRQGRRWDSNTSSWRTSGGAGPRHS